MKGKRYYFKKKNPLRIWLTICPTIMIILVFFLWDRADGFTRIAVIAAIPSVFCCYLMFAFGFMFIDEEGIKMKILPFPMKTIRWEDLKSVRWNRLVAENRKWRHEIVGDPIYSVRIYPRKGRNLIISSALTDWDELIETLLEECDRRGLGGKVEYKVRQKLWEYQDAKREEEEWEEDAWEDEEMNEEWEEEDEAPEAPVRKRNR